MDFVFIGWLLVGFVGVLLYYGAALIVAHREFEKAEVKE